MNFDQSLHFLLIILTTSTPQHQFVQCAKNSLLISNRRKYIGIHSFSFHYYRFPISFPNSTTENPLSSSPVRASEMTLTTFGTWTAIDSSYGCSASRRCSMYLERRAEIKDQSRQNQSKMLDILCLISFIYPRIANHIGYNT